LRQTTDRLAEIIERRAIEAWERPSHLLKNLSLRLQNQSPENKLAQARQSLTWFGNRLGESILREMENRKTRLERTRGILSALSPEGTLQRGYTITLDASGKPITRAENVSPGATLRIRFLDGEVESEARSVDGPPPGQIERPST
jgi:exodeoxyribonuclease VII large subunit